MRLLIAGGGTGGHLYPGSRSPRRWCRDPGGEVLFVGTARGLEAKVVPAAGYPLELLEVSGLKRMGLAGTLRGLGRLPRALGAVVGHPAQVPARRGAGRGRLRLGPDGAGGRAQRAADGAAGTEQRPRLHQPGAGAVRARGRSSPFPRPPIAFPPARRFRRAIRCDARSSVPPSGAAPLRRQITVAGAGCWWWVAARARGP